VKPACGRFIDTVMSGLLALGYTRELALGFVRETYDRMQPRLRATYDSAAIQERQRREQVAIETERRAREQETDQARAKVLNAAVDDHMACLRQNMRELVPFSVDAAETVVTAILSKCSEFERRRIDLGPALYGLPKADAERVIARKMDETRKVIIAEIVTFRAKLLRGRRDPEPAA